MPTEVQIYKNGTIIPADLSTGGPNWDTSGHLTATSFTCSRNGNITGNVTGNVTGNATGLSGTPNITVGTVTATSFKTSTESTGFLKADGNVDTNTYITQAVPVGAVFHFAASTAPTGYLKANGAEALITAYTTLYNVLTTSGTTFPFGANTNGSGAAGSTHFRLPDLRGEFVRGWADDREVDTGRTFGSSQADDFKSHTHASNIDAPGADIAFSSSGGTAGRGVAYTRTTSNVGLEGGTETRPRNIALLACIKY